MASLSPQAGTALKERVDAACADQEKGLRKYVSRAGGILPQLVLIESLLNLGDEISLNYYNIFEARDRHQLNERVDLLLGDSRY
jgi:hypothetical protein